MRLSVLVVVFANADPARRELGKRERAGARAYFDTPLAHIWPRLACAFPRYRVVHTTRTKYGRNFGAHHCKACVEINQCVGCCRAAPSSSE